MPSSLPLIIARARAGALEQAWRLFREGGYESATTDPAALAVLGRLLKDSALLADGGERVRLLLEAAATYARAHAITPQPYLLINVATLSFLAGDRTAAISLAGEVLAMLDSGASLAETPYWLAATRAEALFLRSDVIGGEAELGRAIALDPDNWDDHASTLRQFRLIFAAAGINPSWLDAHRPPGSLHFAGHLGVPPGDCDRLADEIAAILRQERIGFGYGALAAGSDIVVAEALLARGADLHAVLPTGVAAFVAQSVAPYGANWTERFERCLSAATSVRSATGVDGDYEPQATSLAADLAMGAAILNARRLESEAIQLVVADLGKGRYGDGIGTARDAERWVTGGHRQYVIRWRRDPAVAASGRSIGREGRPDRRLAALLHISLDGLDGLDDAGFARVVDSDLAPLRDRLANVRTQPDLVLPCGNARIAAFASVDAAWLYARAALAAGAGAMPVRIAAHYGLIHRLHSPDAVTGPAIARLSAVANATIPGTITASDSFAAALFVAAHPVPHAELVGEVDDIRLFSLRG